MVWHESGLSRARSLGAVVERVSMVQRELLRHTCKTTNMWCLTTFRGSYDTCLTTSFCKGQPGNRQDDA